MLNTIHKTVPSWPQKLDQGHKYYTLWKRLDIIIHFYMTDLNYDTARVNQMSKKMGEHIAPTPIDPMLSELGLEVPNMP